MVLLHQGVQGALTLDEGKDRNLTPVNGLREPVNEEEDVASTSESDSEGSEEKPEKPKKPISAKRRAQNDVFRKWYDEDHLL